MKLKKVLDSSVYDLKNLEVGKKIFDNAPVYFHWSNSAASTQYLQSLADQNEEFQQSVAELSAKLDQLRNVPLWLKTDGHIISMTLFDVYLAVINYIKRTEHESELFNSQNISFVGPSGPYKHTTFVQIINKKVFQDFVYFYLLKNKLPMRDFRLFVEGTVVVHYGNGHQFSARIKVKQLAQNGILFSTTDDALMEKLAYGKTLKFVALSDNIKNLQKSQFTQGPTVNDLFFTTDSMQYFVIEEQKVLKSLSFDSGFSGEYCLFCRYFDMKESEFPEVIKEFLEFSKSFIFKDVA